MHPIIVLGQPDFVGMLIAVIEATERGESQLTAIHVCGQLAAYLCKSPKKNTQTGVYLKLHTLCMHYKSFVHLTYCIFFLQLSSLQVRLRSRGHCHKAPGWVWLVLLASRCLLIRATPPLVLASSEKEHLMGKYLKLSLSYSPLMHR